MKHTAFVVVTKELLDELLPDCFFQVFVRRSGYMLVLMPLVWIGIVKAIGVFEVPLLVVGGLLWLRMLYVLIRGYFSFRAAGYELLKHAENGKLAVMVEMDEKGVTWTSEHKTAQSGWDQITRIRESKKAFYLVQGRLPLLHLPKSRLPADMLAFLRAKKSGAGLSSGEVATSPE